MPRCVRPTSANHYFFLTSTRALGFRPCFIHLTLFKGVRCDRRVRRFTTLWTRFDGPCGNEEGCSPLRNAGDCPSARISLRSRLRLWHLVTLRAALPPLKDSLRGDRRIETAFTGSREGNGLSRSEMPSSDSSSRFACSSSSAESFDADRVVHHLLAARSAFRHSCGKQRTRFGFCNLMNYDARARPIELKTLSRAGAVARFALRRCYPPGEPRPSASPFGTCLEARCIRLRVVRVSGPRRLSLSLRARAAPARMRRVGDKPRLRCVRRRSSPLLHDAPSCDDPPRHHGERRGPRPASSCL